jgi:excinuclease ABC subunit C
MENLNAAKLRLAPPVDAVPDAPGIYRFYDEKEVLLYIGKAKSLSKRINSYFKLDIIPHGRMSEVISSAHRIDWVITATEKEALILEALWIRRYQPRYNIRLLESDAFGGVVIYNKNIVPKIGLWRGKRPSDGISFGPFPNTRGRDALDALSSSFGIRSCNEKIYKRAELSNRPCLLGEIGKCVAPCLGTEQKELHQIRTKAAIEFLVKSDRNYLSLLEEDMLLAAENQQFELAALKRDQLTSLVNMLTKQSANTTVLTPIDALSYVTYQDLGALSVVSLRQGEIKSVRSFSAEIDNSLTLPEQFIQILSLAVSDEGKDSIPPKLILVDLPLNDDFKSNLRNIYSDNKLSIKNPKSGKFADLLAIAARNSQESIGNLELKRNSKLVSRISALDDLAQALNSKSKFNRIECIDISHTQGKLPVASIVVMVDGITKQNEYRRIFLPPELGGDDYASIRHAVERRFTGSKCGLTNFPDLLLIDGGVNQANAAFEILSPLLAGSDLKVEVVGLAKRLEELWPALASDPVLISRSSQALVLCQRVRDEAHRWAISGHRRRRESSALKSQLDDISGIGPSKRKLLIEIFGSEKAVLRATVQELSQINGIGPNLANKIYSSLHD